MKAPYGIECRAAGFGSGRRAARVMGVLILGMGPTGHAARVFAFEMGPVDSRPVGDATLVALEPDCLPKRRSGGDAKYHFSTSCAELPRPVAPVNPTWAVFPP